MHYLYVLQNLKDEGYYLGISENPKLRLKEHNSGKTKSIKHRIPFIMKHFEKYETKTEARKKEIQLKKTTKKEKNF